MDCGIVDVVFPSVEYVFVRYVLLSFERPVLTVARCDDDGDFVEESVFLVRVRSVVDPIIELALDEAIKSGHLVSV